MADWLKCHSECPDQTLNLVTPPSRGLLVGEKKAHEALVLSCQYFVLGPQGEEESAVLEVHRLYYLVIAHTAVCLPFTDSDP